MIIPDSWNAACGPPFMNGQNINPAHKLTPGSPLRLQQPSFTTFKCSPANIKLTTVALARTPPGHPLLKRSLTTKLIIFKSIESGGGGERQMFSPRSPVESTSRRTH